MDENCLYSAFSSAGLVGYIVSRSYCLNVERLTLSPRKPAINWSRSDRKDFFSYQLFVTLEKFLVCQPSQEDSVLQPVHPRFFTS